MHPSLATILSHARPSPYPTAICAHRGDSQNAPENTLAAFRWALEAEAELIELDLFRSRDGAYVVIHDGKLDRTTDRAGEIAELTLEEIRASDAGRWFTESFAGETVPTLGEVLDLLKEEAVPLIEIKEKTKPSDGYDEGIVELLRRHDMVEQSILLCRDTDLVERLHALEPRVPLALLTFTGRTSREAARTLPIQGVVPYYKLVKPSLIRTIHGLGCFLLPWTVNKPKEMRKHLEWGVDGIITDIPRVLRDLMEERELERVRWYLTKGSGRWVPAVTRELPDPPEEQ